MPMTPNGRRSRSPVHHRDGGEAAPARPPKPTGPLKVCKTCAFFFKSTLGTMCTCMADSGVPRDKNATDEHCETYKKGKGMSEKDIFKP